MSDASQLDREFATLDLGDARLNRRAVTSLMALSKQPGFSPPKVLKISELEGFYRFVGNKEVDLPSLMKAHVDATLDRIRGLHRLVVSHDSSGARFSEEVPREGLGPMDGGGQGFYMHVALACGGRFDPLGVLGMETWVRESGSRSKRSQVRRHNDPDRESLRWLRMVDEVERVMAGHETRIIHVMDREADDYNLLSHLVQHSRGFVIRSSHDRRLWSETHESTLLLREFVRDLDVQWERDAKLSNRTKTGRAPKDVKKFPPRKPREAQLVFTSRKVSLLRPEKASKALPEQLTLNVVYVNEPNPPEGCQPVEWFLFTSEPVDTEEQVLQVVDDYRQRWLIEELFKALKTGCAYEQRQHESLRALLNVLGIFIPIAWSLLRLRALARCPARANDPASEILTAIQLQVLSAKSEGRVGTKLTIYEALRAIATYFGGHLKGNGEPGWQVLGRGYEELLQAEFYWTLALTSMQKSVGTPITAATTPAKSDRKM
jgi:Transposase DNA-binding/Transposase DDE domain